MKKHTPFCIICGEKFDGNVKPSKEHIIPKALGNGKLITYNVCEKCNNDLGGNVDNYLTDYILIKIIRKCKVDENTQVFDKRMTDDKGDTYLVKNDKLETMLDVNSDKASGHITIKASTIEEGLKIARGILRGQYGKTEDEIDAIFADPDKFMQKTEAVMPGTFVKETTLDLARFRLAAIKIAYEFAIEKLGESYALDEDALILRAYLKAGRDGKREFSDKEAKDICQRCHMTDSFTDTIKNILQNFEQESNGRKINYFVHIVRDQENKLICCIRILDENFLAFTVLLSKDASKYLSESNCGYCVIILDDGEFFDM